MAVFGYCSDVYRLREALGLQGGAHLGATGPQIGVWGVPVGGVGGGGGGVHVGHGQWCATCGGVSLDVVPGGLVVVVTMGVVVGLVSPAILKLR